MPEARPIAARTSTVRVVVLLLGLVATVVGAVVLWLVVMLINRESDT